MEQLQRLDAAAVESRRCPVERLAATCDPASLSFRTTADLPPLDTGIIGQERAVRAVEFGLAVDHPGYNLFLAGPVGTGRSTYAETKVRQVAATQPTPPDWCYLFNFQQPDQPVAVSLPPGQGQAFRRDMAELVEDLRREIRRVFESEDYERRRTELLQSFEARVNAVWQQLDERARALGFIVQRSPAGIVTVPVTRDGRPLSHEAFDSLPEEVREAITQRGRTLQQEVAEALRQTRLIEKEARQRLRALEEEIGHFAVDHLIQQMKDAYGHHDGVASYLDQVAEDILQHLDLFRSDGGEEEPSSPLAALQQLSQRRAMTRYQVNLLVDHSGTQGAPVVVENNPTFYNLFGKIEYRGDFGTMVTDFTLIKPGALHLANGGYLILPAMELLQNPFAWQGLKRALKSGCIRIENLSEQYVPVPTTSLKPMPVPFRAKVILIGNPLLYHLLYAYDEDFRKLFKIKADFDTTMKRVPEHVELFARFIAGFAQREGLLPFTAAAVARLVDHSSRLAEDQEKLSTRFHEVTEVLVEASAWARSSGKEVVEAEDVEKALSERVFRSNRVEAALQELIEEGTLLVDTEGAKIAQVNGLAVIDLGDYRFGRPNRITARTYLGEKGILNIERETEMSGPIHSKGVYILSAFLAGRYAQDKPLSLSASICFEQVYEEVDGDSASSTELYALLSALSGLPIDQGIAVTGSVNQHGEIQPIGGVNEKIEGFFDVCKAKGLTGRQGVIIPVQNVRNLMLREDVRRAVAEGRFHIWAVRTVDEGIEILTGVRAGERQADGTWPEGTINFLVDRRLREMAEQLRQFAHEDEEKEDGAGT
ncbi:MAG: AAA family ATPase [Clostridia bacterium]|nr:AAA family ATPase [Clostridia bacterium]